MTTTIDWQNERRLPLTGSSTYRDEATAWSSIPRPMVDALSASTPFHTEAELHDVLARGFEQAARGEVVSSDDLFSD